MDENSLKRVFAKAQKFGTMLDSTSAEFQEFAEQFIAMSREVQQLLRDKESLIAEKDALKAQLAKYEAPVAKEATKTIADLKREVLGTPAPEA